MKESISSRLKQIMSQKGLKQVDILNLSAPLQRKYNIRLAKNDLSQYVNGKVEPNQERIFLLSKTLNVSEAWLLGYNVPQEIVDKDDNASELMGIYSKLEQARKDRVYNFATEQLEDQNKVINLSDFINEDLYGYASAGTGQQVFDNPVETIQLHKSDVPSQHYDLVLQVVGDSMEPAFKDGEYIFIRKTENLRNGQFGVFIINGESYLKKVYVEDDHLRLVSLNEKYEDLTFNENDGITLVGQVVL